MKSNMVDSTFLFFVTFGTLLIQCSNQSIFSSVLRNNLNRYLKNPIFTKSFVRHSSWPGEFDDVHGGSLPLIPQQSNHITEFIKSQNKFTSDHVFKPLGANYNFDLLSLHNEFGGMVPPPQPPSPNSPTGGHPIQQVNNIKQQGPISPPAQRINHKMTSGSSPSATIAIVAIQPPESMTINRQPIDNGTVNYGQDKNWSSRNRLNSKSLTVTKNTNAYSDMSKLKQHNNKQQLANVYSHNINNNNNNVKLETHSNDPWQSITQSNNTNRYGERHSQSKPDTIRHNNPSDSIGENRNFENLLLSGNKYNQEKALNLKLEYGFKPLPTKGSNSGDSFRKDFTVGDSIQMNDPFDTPKSSSINETPTSAVVQTEKTKENNDANESGNNIYSNVDSSNEQDDLPNRSMKSLMTDNSKQPNLSNHLEEFAPDYKKYISYPMETESSDIHKLAFTGVESFKPDVDSPYNSDHRFVDTLANYHNMKHFKTQGIECARQPNGYCEYDSSYPKDHVNSIISNCSDLLDSMYIEMPENLADFNGYKSFIQIGRQDSSQTANNSLCDSERKYIRPSVIQDTNSEFYLILQSSYYFQQVPVEICSKPGLSCNVVGRCNSQVKCTQKYRTHMLISVDTATNGPNHHHRHHHHHQQKESQHNQHRSHQSAPYENHSSVNHNCPKMRMYRLPSACVCELV